MESHHSDQDCTDLSVSSYNGSTLGPLIYVAYYDTGLSDWVIDGSQLNVDSANAALDPGLAYHDDLDM